MNERNNDSASDFEKTELTVVAFALQTLLEDLREWYPSSGVSEHFDLRIRTLIYDHTAKDEPPRLPRTVYIDEATQEYRNDEAKRDGQYIQRVHEIRKLLKQFEEAKTLRDVDARKCRHAHFVLKGALLRSVAQWGDGLTKSKFNRTVTYGRALESLSMMSGTKPLETSYPFDF